MKILMTTDTVGGVWTYSLELINGLAHYDVEVALATLGRRLSADQRGAVEQLANVEVFESNYRLEWMEDPWDDVQEAGRWLLRLRDHIQPDLIHLNDYSQGSLAWEAPVLMVGHSCVCSWMQHVRGAPPDGAWDEYRKRVERGLRAASCVVTPTQRMLDDLRLNYGTIAPGKVIYNGCAAPPAISIQREPFIFAAGRLWDEAKNIGLLAEIADRVDWPICVAGSAEHPDGHGPVKWKNLRMLGHLSQRQLYKTMARASLYALPAKYEPFGLTPLEAALHGCPLVLGDIGTLREVWGDAAAFAPPHAPEDWVQRLNSLINDRASRDRLAEKACRRARRYSLSRMTNDYYDTYCSLRRGGRVASGNRHHERLCSHQPEVLL